MTIHAIRIENGYFVLKNLKFFLRCQEINLMIFLPHIIQFVIHIIHIIIMIHHENLGGKMLLPL